MTFESFAKDINSTFESLLDGLSSLAECVSGILPKPREIDYRVNAKQLAEDVADRDYDLVQRDNVRVRRDGETAVCLYETEAGFEEFKQYDLTEVTES